MVTTRATRKDGNLYFSKKIRTPFSPNTFRTITLSLSYFLKIEALSCTNHTLTKASNSI